VSVDWEAVKVFVAMGGWTTSAGPSPDAAADGGGEHRPPDQKREVKLPTSFLQFVFYNNHLVSLYELH